MDNIDTFSADQNDISGMQIEDSLIGFSSPFSSGFDDEHPMPSYDELRNAGFSDYLSNQILYGVDHCYSQRELFNALYSDNPLEAYNEMMDGKVNDVLSRSDKLIEDIQNEFGI